MGTFEWPLRISSMDGQQAQDIEATVDTGAAYTTLPSSLLRELGVEPMGSAGSCWRTGGGSIWTTGGPGPQSAAAAR